MTKLVSLALLGGVFGIGAASTDGPAIAAGSNVASIAATLAVIVLMFVGIFSWSRIVRAAHEAEQASEEASGHFTRTQTLSEAHPKSIS
jgi:hypothetical protein